MADICDIAAEQMEFLQGHTEAARRAASTAPEYYSGDCEECGESVEEPRRVMGFHVCAECAQYMEKRERARGKLYAK